MFYDPKRKTIVDYGSSRACGENYNRFSIHAEQKAIHYCLKNDKNNRYKIFISRYGRKGNHKSAFCCRSCTKLATKFSFQNKIFTFNEDLETIPAVVENPGISLAYKIKYGL